MKIVDLNLGKVAKRIEALGFKVEITDRMREFIAEKGFDKQFGARPLNRTIQKYIEDPIADELLTLRLTENSLLRVDLRPDSDEVVIEHIEGSTAAPSEVS